MVRKEIRVGDIIEFYPTIQLVDTFVDRVAGTVSKRVEKSCGNVDYWEVKLFEPIPEKEIEYLYFIDKKYLESGKLVTMRVDGYYSDIYDHIPKHKIPKSLDIKSVLRFAFSDLVFTEISSITASSVFPVYVNHVNQWLDKPQKDTIKSFQKSYFYRGVGTKTKQTDQLNLKTADNITFDNNGYASLHGLHHATRFVDHFMAKDYINYLPEKSQLIVGLVDRKNNKYHRWFVCSNEFVLFWCYLFGKDHALLQKDVAQELRQKTLYPAPSNFEKLYNGWMDSYSFYEYLVRCCQNENEYQKLKNEFEPKKGTDLYHAPMCYKFIRYLLQRFN